MTKDQAVAKPPWTIRAMRVLLADVLPPFHPRPLDPATLDELEKSIPVEGILQAPLGVVEDGKVRMIDGQHRGLVAKRLGHTHLEMNVIQEPIRPGEQLLLGFASNRLRRGLDPMTEAITLHTILEETGMLPTKLSERMGVPLTHITRRLDLRKLAADLQELVRGKKLPFSFAVLIARIDDHAAQRELAKRALGIPLTRDELDMEVREFFKKRRTGKPKPAKVKTKGVKCELTGDPNTVIEELNSIITAIKKCVKEGLPFSVLNNLLGKPAE